jgi:hypothetical protein
LWPDGEPRGGFDELRAWLGEHGVTNQKQPMDLGAVTASLEQWFDTWNQERVRIARTAPERLAFAPSLAKLIGRARADDSWRQGFADLVITGERCALYRTLVGQKPVDLSREFVDAARAFRDADVRELPEAGLWFRATLSLDSNGILNVKRHYVDEPNRREIRLDDAGLRVDAARMPRSPYWTPDWLAKRLRRA